MIFLKIKIIWCGLGYSPWAVFDLFSVEFCGLNAVLGFFREPFRCGFFGNFLEFFRIFRVGCEQVRWLVVDCFGIQDFLGWCVVGDRFGAVVEKKCDEVGVYDGYCGVIVGKGGKYG